MTLVFAKFQYAITHEMNDKFDEFYNLKSYFFCRKIDSVRVWNPAQAALAQPDEQPDQPGRDRGLCQHDEARAIDPDKKSAQSFERKVISR